MSLQNAGGEYITAIGKAAPSIAVTSATIAGMALQEWVLAATLLYTVLQIALLVRKFIKDWFNGR